MNKNREITEQGVTKVYEIMCLWTALINLCSTRTISIIAVVCCISILLFILIILVIIWTYSR